MKRCPECRRSYHDDTLSFCLEDGSELVLGVPAPDEPATAIFTAEAPTLSPPTSLTGKSGLKTRTTASRRNSLIAGVVGLLIVTTLGVGGLVYYGRGSSVQLESIAVLPFVNESGNADIEYLTDGMTETLISSLSQLPNLKVKARNSVFRYKGRDAGTKEIAGELAVQAVLLGRVAQNGDRLSLRLELVDAATETVIWSEGYNRSYTDLPVLQTEIARDVSDKLRMRLSGSDRQLLEKLPTQNAEAYQLYLRGRYEWNKRKKDSLLLALEHFKQAVQADPAFALAYAGMADCYIVFNTYEVAPPTQSYPLARAAVQKALELDPTLGPAYSSLAAINEDFDWDFGAADRYYQRAIELDPHHPTTHQWYAEFLRMVGRRDEAVAASKRAMELDPMSLPVNTSYGLTLFYAGRCDEAIPQFQRTIDLDSSFSQAHEYMARCLVQTGKYEEALAEHLKSIELSNRGEGTDSALASYIHTLSRNGNRDEARNMIKRLEERRKTQFVDPALMALAYYAVGDLNGVFTELEKAYQVRSPEVRYIKVEPRYGDDLRRDPRYIELVRKIGLP